MSAQVRLVTWNLFHCRAGHPDVGPSWRSTLLGRPEWDAAHVHVNRKLTDVVAAILREANPDVATLQEVPPADIDTLALATATTATTARIRPRLGPAGLRARLARTNPDLWRSHEGNANAILVREGIAVAGTGGRLRLNPPRLVAAAVRAGALSRGEAANWAWEERAAVLTRIATPAGPLSICCVHLHTRPAAAAMEARRLAEWLVTQCPAGPLVVAGDFNVGRGHSALDALVGLGLADASSADGIDRVLTRGCDVTHVRRWDPVERERIVRWRGAARRVRVSDHDPVSVTLRLPA